MGHRPEQDENRTPPEHDDRRPVFFKPKLLRSPIKHHRTTTNTNSTTETHQPQNRQLETQRPLTLDHSSIGAGLFAHQHHPPDLEHPDWYGIGRGKPVGRKEKQKIAYEK
ncbi:hypothetical protein RHMOL_Rhmol04G0295400 [Rhododendron molle]|uniref:Uncharacterized protein n=1 Tax=Rhododendron molle TaxID=49168 RepID=A0ACC0P704_RHOML|nr:hypothetical protein RHMOL_Rhmol04G0295400 [Rhododendron molle]